MLTKKAEYRLDLFSQWVTRGAFLTGLAFFLRALFYFGFVNILDCDMSVLLLELAVPMVLLAAVMLTIRIFLAEDPRVYAILGVLACVLLTVWALQAGNLVHTVLAVIWYLAAAAVLVLTAWGILPTLLPAKAVFVVPILFRLCFCNYDALYFRDWKIVEFLPEASALCLLGTFACLMLSLTEAEQEVE